MSGLTRKGGAEFLYLFEGSAVDRDQEQAIASTHAEQTLGPDDGAHAKSRATIADLLAMPRIEDIDLVFERSTELVKPAQFLD